MVKSDTIDGVNKPSTSNLPNLSTVPLDATIHELTSNTIWFLEKLFYHFDVIGDVLLHDVIFAAQFKAFTETNAITKDEDRNRILLGFYIST